MNKTDKMLIKRNENWIKLSKKSLKKLVEKVVCELNCIEDLSEQCRELKDREGNKKVYKGVFENEGKEVTEGEAFSYMIKKIFDDPRERKEMIECFYSGNWIEDER